MTREDAFNEINATQDFYINELVKLINDIDYTMLKMLNFTSDTGTGKTKMMAKLINKFPDYFFIVTSLNKSGLHKQIRNNLKKDCKQKNWVVYGTADYRKNSRLQANDILDLIPKDKRCIWLRDEAHIKTNRFDELLLDYEDVVGKCYAVINVSATNCDGAGITCDFSQTMMLRKINQKIVSKNKGPLEALEKLIEVKEQHKNVPNYNPCAIFRLVSRNDEWYEKIKEMCDKLGLKYIDLIDNDDYDMSDICKDDNEYDVIINKYKIVEGIDLRRAHVLYMDNQPGNLATVIQCIGRCKRNALLYRNDIDIFAPENSQLLKDTRECYVFYNTYDIETQHDDMELDEDLQNLQMQICPFISCQRIKPGTILNIVNGQMENGLYIMELCTAYNGVITGHTGQFTVELDKDLGFNVIYPSVKKYNTNITDMEEYVYFTIDKDCKKCKIINLANFPLNDYDAKFDWSKGKLVWDKVIPYYNMKGTKTSLKKIEISDDVIKYFLDNKPIINKNYILNHIKTNAKENKDYKNLEFRLYKEVESLTELNNLPIQIITKDDIDECFKDLERQLCQFSTRNKELTDDQINKIIKKVEDNYKSIEKELNKKKVLVVCNIKNDTLSQYIEDCDDLEKWRCNIDHKIRLQDYQYIPYKKITNDKESAIIGIEVMHMLKDDNDRDFIIWAETKSVSSKVNVYSKFKTFIDNKYAKEIDFAKDLTVKGKNTFNFDEKCNSMLGYLVEYYSKYLVYGDAYLQKYIEKAMQESNVSKPNDAIIVRACMFKYKENMMSAFGKSVGKVIKGLSTEELIQENYKEFIDTVIELGKKTSKFIKNTLYKNRPAIDNICPNLSLEHITGLADYITEDTILDVKVRNNIDMSCIRQVLAYQYLSTKRSDLNIKRVIVYDATSGRHVTVNIEPENWKENCKYGYNACSKCT